MEKAMRSRAETMDGEERLIYEAFADSIESLVRTLASNAGMKPIITMTTLKKKHSSSNGAAYAPLLHRIGRRNQAGQQESLLHRDSGIHVRGPENINRTRKPACNRKHNLARRSTKGLIFSNIERSPFDGGTRATLEAVG
ncbi:MAG: hypothetical protein FGF50_07935 [Candidatus Brockarchaeota archaeon]|nr:hypothetical protein [Candidatus Brockarchaeota archaeon]